MNHDTVGALANTKTAELGSSVYGSEQGDATDITTTMFGTGATGMTSVDVTIGIKGAGAGATVQTVTIKADANMTSDEALGKVIQAINSKTADTGITAFLSEDKSKVEYRATAEKVGEVATAAITYSRDTDVTGLGTNLVAAASIEDIAAGAEKGIDGGCAEFCVNG